MAQRLLNVRVRPPRVAVLINRHSAEADLLLAFQFFSKIWGGRFGQLLPVEPNASDPLTEFRLARSRPEFVYGVGVDDACWQKLVNQCCQPRAYDNLSEPYVHEIAAASPRSKDYYLVDHALIHLSQTRDQNKGRNRALRLVNPSTGSAHSAYLGAMFGVHHQNLRKELFDIESPFTSSSTTEFIELAIEFVKEWQQCWIDVTGHRLNLNPLMSEIGPLAPTVVLVGSKVPDLALFWNLRGASDTLHSPWIIPIPVESVNDDSVIQKLKEWLLAFRKYGRLSNYCQVTSQTVEAAGCRHFVDQFRDALSGTPIEFVDFQPPRNRLPLVVPFEYETAWPAELSGRRLTILPPKPKAFEELSTSRAWTVDLLKDLKTNRAVKELQLPPSPVVFELLNGPCPPGFVHTIIPRAGDGVDSINLRVAGSDEVVNIFLPPAEEILEEILHEYGYVPVHDEKRTSYSPVIKRFGGLYLAASDLSGQFGTVLNSLLNDTNQGDRIFTR